MGAFNNDFSMYNARSILYLFITNEEEATMSTTNATPSGTIPFEHERRFFPELRNLPFDFSRFPSVFIIQGYLEDGLGTRLRDERTTDGRHTYLQTRKTGEGVSRAEDEQEISEKDFRLMWNDVKCSLEKTRYFISRKGIDLQLNIFHGKLEQYLQIEVEFDSNEDALAFIPPVWFGREVTDDKQHGNYALAKNGVPK